LPKLFYYPKKQTSKHQGVEKMSTSNRNINLPFEEEGKWAQFWITREELALITGIILQAGKQGLRLSQSAVIRQILQKGWDNIDLYEARTNPSSLFSVKGGSAK
jgi:hypothetical protein